MAKSRIVNSVINTIYGVMVKMANFLASFILRTAFIRTLGMEYAGVSGLFTDILTVLSFAELGISGAMTYALYKPIAEQDTKKIGQLMNFYRTAYRWVAGTVLTAGTLCIPFLNVIVKDVPNIRESLVLIYVLYLVNTASSYLLIYKSTLLTASQKQFEISRITIIFSVLKCILGCALLFIFKNFIVYLCLEIIISFSQNVYIGSRADSLFPEIVHSREKLEKREIKSLFKDVRALFMYKVSEVVLNGTDSLIISSCLGTGLVGILSNYNLIVKNIYRLVMQAFNAAAASIGNLAVTENGEKQYSVFKTMLFLSFWFFGFCTVEIYIGMNSFMEIWMGKENTFSMGIVIILLIDFYLTGMMSPVGAFRTSNGLFVQGQFRPLIMAVINIVISFVLVYRIGVAGVLLGTVVSRLVTQVWYDPYLIYKNVFDKPLFLYLKNMIIYAVFTVTVCVVSSVVIGKVMIQNRLLSLFINAIICGMIFNGVFLGVFWRTDEFVYLKNTGISFLHLLKKKVK